MDPVINNKKRKIKGVLRNNVVDVYSMRTIPNRRRYRRVSFNNDSLGSRFSRKLLTGKRHTKKAKRKAEANDDDDDDDDDDYEDVDEEEDDESDEEDDYYDEDESDEESDSEEEDDIDEDEEEEDTDEEDDEKSINQDEKSITHDEKSINQDEKSINQDGKEVSVESTVNQEKPSKTQEMKKQQNEQIRSDETENRDNASYNTVQEDEISIKGDYHIYDDNEVEIEEVIDDQDEDLYKWGNIKKAKRIDKEREENQDLKIQYTEQELVVIEAEDKSEEKVGKEGYRFLKEGDEEVLLTVVDKANYDKLLHNTNDKDARNSTEGISREDSGSYVQIERNGVSYRRRNRHGNCERDRLSESGRDSRRGRKGNSSRDTEGDRGKNNERYTYMVRDKKRYRNRDRESDRNSTISRESERGRRKRRLRGSRKDWEVDLERSNRENSRKRDRVKHSDRDRERSINAYRKIDRRSDKDSYVEYDVEGDRSDVSGNLDIDIEDDRTSRGKRYSEFDSEENRGNTREKNMEIYKKRDREQTDRPEEYDVESDRDSNVSSDIIINGLHSRERETRRNQANGTEVARDYGVGSGRGESIAMERGKYREIDNESDRESDVVIDREEDIPRHRENSKGNYTAREMKYYKGRNRQRDGESSMLQGREDSISQGREGFRGNNRVIDRRESQGFDTTFYKESDRDSDILQDRRMYKESSRPTNNERENYEYNIRNKEIFREIDVEGNRKSSKERNREWYNGIYKENDRKSGREHDIQSERQSDRGAKVNANKIEDDKEEDSKEIFRERRGSRYRERDGSTEGEKSQKGEVVKGRDYDVDRKEDNESSRRKGVYKKNEIINADSENEIDRRRAKETGAYRRTEGGREVYRNISKEVARESIGENFGNRNIHRDTAEYTDKRKYREDQDHYTESTTANDILRARKTDNDDRQQRSDRENDVQRYKAKCIEKDTERDMTWNKENNKVKAFARIEDRERYTEWGKKSEIEPGRNKLLHNKDFRERDAEINKEQDIEWARRINKEQKRIEEDPDKNGGTDFERYRNKNIAVERDNTELRYYKRRPENQENRDREDYLDRHQRIDGNNDRTEKLNNIEERDSERNRKWANKLDLISDDGGETKIDRSREVYREKTATTDKEKNRGIDAEIKLESYPERIRETDVERYRNRIEEEHQERNRKVTTETGIETGRRDDIWVRESNTEIVGNEEMGERQRPRDYEEKHKGGEGGRDEDEKSYIEALNRLEERNKTGDRERDRNRESERPRDYEENHRVEKRDIDQESYRKESNRLEEEDKGEESEREKGRYASKFQKKESKLVAKKDRDTERLPRYIEINRELEKLRYNDKQKERYLEINEKIISDQERQTRKLNREEDIYKTPRRDSAKQTERGRIGAVWDRQIYSDENNDERIRESERPRNRAKEEYREAIRERNVIEEAYGTEKSSRNGESGSGRDSERSKNRVNERNVNSDREEDMNYVMARIREKEVNRNPTRTSEIDRENDIFIGNKKYRAHEPELSKRMPTGSHKERDKEDQFIKKDKGRSSTEDGGENRNYVMTRTNEKEVNRYPARYREIDWENDKFRDNENYIPQVTVLNKEKHTEDDIERDKEGTKDQLVEKGRNRTDREEIMNYVLARTRQKEVNLDARRGIEIGEQNDRFRDNERYKPHARDLSEGRYREGDTEKDRDEHGVQFVDRNDDLFDRGRVVKRNMEVEREEKGIREGKMLRNSAAKTAIGAYSEREREMEKNYSGAHLSQKEAPKINETDKSGEKETTFNREREQYREEEIFRNGEKDKEIHWRNNKVRDNEIDRHRDNMNRENSKKESDRKETNDKEKEGDKEIIEYWNRDSDRYIADTQDIGEQDLKILYAGIAFRDEDRLRDENWEIHRIEETGSSESDWQCNRGEKVNHEVDQSRNREYREIEKDREREIHMGSDREMENERDREYKEIEKGWDREVEKDKIRQCREIKKNNDREYRGMEKDRDRKYREKEKNGRVIERRESEEEIEL